MTETELLIVGAGAAGLGCARSACAAGLSSVLAVDSAERLGGILPQCLHKGFGLQRFGTELTGPEFLERLRETLPQSLDLRLETTVIRVFPDRTALISSPVALERVRFRELIWATGCREKSIWSLPLAGTRPAGVLSAGLAQQLVNLEGICIGERIVVLGSGDVGLVMAGRFAELGKKPLAIIEKRPQLGGLVRNRKRYVEQYDIPVLLNTEVEELHGGKTLSGVTLRHTDTDEREYISCDTLITALGLIPEQTLLDGLREDGRLPDWVQLAGNCDYVHDMADAVLRDADEIGARAALRIRNAVKV